MSVADKLGLAPRRVVYLGSGSMYMIKVTPPAFVGGKPQYVMLDEGQYNRYLLWERGMPIQQALPDLSPSDREVLMSGFAL
jgi:hypothetical protein